MRSTHQAENQIYLEQPSESGWIGALKAGKNANTIYGDERDCNFLLKDLIVRQHKMLKALPAINLYGPVKLEIEDEKIAADSERAELKRDDLYNEMMGALLANPDEICKLAIPILCNGNHWCFFEAELVNRKIIHAKYRNPKKQDDDCLMASSAYVRIQNLVNEINGDDSVIVEFSCGEQEDDFTCLDVCIKWIYELFNLRNEITEAGVNEITETGINKLRSASLAVCAKHPEVQALKRSSPIIEQVTHESDSESTESVETDSELTDDEIVNVDETLPAIPVAQAQAFAALQYQGEQDNEDLYDNLHENKAMQINFDYVMAVKLQGLFKDRPKANEEDLFRQARQEAWEELNKKLKI